MNLGLSTALYTPTPTTMYLGGGYNYHTFQFSLDCDPKGLTNNKSALVQVIVWCCQVTVMYVKRILFITKSIYLLQMSTGQVKGWTVEAVTAWGHYSLAPGKSAGNFKTVIFEHMLWIKFMSTCEMAFMWIPQNIFDDKSTLVQVMVWCCQAPSHYESQC